MKRKNNIQKSSKNNANKKRNISNTRTYKDIISKLNGKNKYDLLINIKKRKRYFNA